MTKRHVYNYTILRYVHDVVSGESLNIGVAMHAPGAGFLRFQPRKTIRRLKNVFPDLDRQAFTAAMNAISRGFADWAEHLRKGALFEGQANVIGYAHRVLPLDDSTLQWSSPATGLTDDLDSTFERLYARYVTQYDVNSGKRRSDDDVWKPVQHKLIERGVDVPFQSRTVMGTQDQIEFKKAWKNGRWHAYQPVSFDLADAERIMDKARKWRGHLEAVAVGAVEEIDLHFLLGLPGDGSLMHAYHNAKTILGGASFTKDIVDENEIDTLVDSIENEYHGRLASTIL